MSVLPLVRCGLMRVLVDISLRVVRNQNLDDVALFGRFGGGNGIKAVLFGQIVVPGTRPLAYNHFHAAIAQVKRLRMTLASKADNGDLFS